jgi:ABC-type nitrate/sulfonate/bicarbonate transport system substrate-binding protein
MTIPIEYGVPTDKCGLQLRLGIEKGFFRDEGLDLSVRVVFGGPEIAAAYDAGRLKIGELGTPPGLTAIGKGARFKIVGSSVRRGAVQYFVAQPEFSDWPALAGQKLGVLTIGSCSYWFMREVVGHYGLDPDRDVDIIGLGPRYPQVVDLVSSGELAGAIISEPNVSIGEATGGFNVWLGLNRVDFVPSMQWSIMVANHDALQDEAELLGAVLRGCRRSYRYAADNRDEWADFGARHFDIPRKVMARSIAREFEDLHFDCQIDLPGLAVAIALQRKLGAIATDLAVDAITDMRFQSTPLPT